MLPQRTEPVHSSSFGSLVWLRRDLRLIDNKSLQLAMEFDEPITMVFVFDREILDALKNPYDRRVEFIWEAVDELHKRSDGKLVVLFDRARDAIPKLAGQLNVRRVIAARDYEPQAIDRDQCVEKQLVANDIEFTLVKDQVIFELQEVLTQADRPFTVFTPYKNAWLKRLSPSSLSFDNTIPQPIWASTEPSVMLDLVDIGFKRTNLKALKFSLSESGAQILFEDFAGRLGQYGNTRDFPAIKGPSYLSTHLRFGTISIRQLAQTAWERWKAGGPEAEGAERWLYELIWRDFYFQILANFPHAAQGAFKPEYDLIVWENDPILFAAWCEGKTGFPLVDAAMRQLNQTGYMHNRLRMVVASFLTKDLAIDWRWGEKYFAEQLNDFDLSANNGGWQWAASSGCDAQPYFRIFNPVSQSERFDAEGHFIRRYCPELSRLSAKAIHAPWECGGIELQAANIELGKDYPHPVVAHDEARKRTLERYSVVKKKEPKSEKGPEGPA